MWSRLGGTPEAALDADGRVDGYLHVATDR
jgi:hypothetical protein